MKGEQIVILESFKLEWKYYLSYCQLKGHLNLVPSIRISYSMIENLNPLSRFLFL